MKRKYFIIYGKKDKYGFAKGTTITARNKMEAFKFFRMSTSHRGKHIHGIALLLKRRRG